MLQEISETEMMSRQLDVIEKGAQLSEIAPHLSTMISSK